jgi:hypothetical protein
MRLTSIHLAYWRTRNAGPAWSAGLQSDDGPTIDACINAHAGPVEARDTTLDLLRTARERGRLVEALATMASNPYASDPPAPRRAQQARRWLDRIARQPAPGRVKIFRGTPLIAMPRIADLWTKPLPYQRRMLDQLNVE